MLRFEVLRREKKYLKGQIGILGWRSLSLSLSIIIIIIILIWIGL